MFQIKDKEMKKFYNGNISKAIIDITKGLPADHFTIAFDNHTGNPYVCISYIITNLNAINMYL